LIAFSTVISVSCLVLSHNGHQSIDHSIIPQQVFRSVYPLRNVLIFLARLRECHAILDHSIIRSFCTGSLFIKHLAPRQCLVTPRVLWSPESVMLSLHIQETPTGCHASQQCTPRFCFMRLPSNTASCSDETSMVGYLGAAVA
jgi:hypothetical protein